jgi:hypothetical protein
MLDLTTLELVLPDLMLFNLIPSDVMLSEMILLELSALLEAIAIGCKTAGGGLILTCSPSDWEKQ